MLFALFLAVVEVVLFVSTVNTVLFADVDVGVIAVDGAVLFADAVARVLFADDVLLSGAFHAVLFVCFFFIFVDADLFAGAADAVRFPAGHVLLVSGAVNAVLLLTVLFYLLLMSFSLLQMMLFCLCC